MMPQKNRCEYELLVEKYFGISLTTVPKTIPVDDHTLVDFACNVHQQLPLPNCLAYALRFWNINRDYKIYYCSGHAINSKTDITGNGWLSASDFGEVYFTSSFESLLDDFEKQLLKEYFK